MAETLWEYAKDPEKLVGLIIYQAYNPRQVGKISAVHPGAHRVEVEVRWLNGKLSRHDTLSLRKFESLVLETERKAQNHRALFEKAQKL